MKKAFTLSEALVTLAIIGVLAAILIPVIDEVKPDRDKLTYKKALYNVQNAISNAMDSNVFSSATNSAAYWKDENVSETAFCEGIADVLNTSGSVNCSGASSYESPNFITTDGIRYWGLEGKFPADERTIFIDRRLNELELEERGDVGLKINVRYDGKVFTPDNPDYAYENELIQEPLNVGND